jgi:hypothetical protein
MHMYREKREGLGGAVVDVEAGINEDGVASINSQEGVSEETHEAHRSSDKTKWYICLYTIQIYTYKYFDPNM